MNLNFKTTSLWVTHAQAFLQIAKMSDNFLEKTHGNHYYLLSFKQFANIFILVGSGSTSYRTQS